MKEKELLQLVELMEAAFPSSVGVMPTKKTSLIQPHQAKPLKKIKPPQPPKATKPKKQQVQRMKPKTYNPFKATTNNPNDIMLTKLSNEEVEESYIAIDEGLFDKLKAKFGLSKPKPKEIVPTPQQQTSVQPQKKSVPAPKTTYTRTQPVKKPAYSSQQTDIIKQLSQVSGPKTEKPDLRFAPAKEGDIVRHSLQGKAYTFGNKNPFHIAASEMELANLPKKKQEESTLRNLINILKESQDFLI